MEVYQSMREFADSWALLGMVLFFIGVVVRSITLPRDVVEAAASIPLDEITPREAEAQKAKEASHG